MSCVKHIWKLKELKLTSTKSLAVSQVTFSADGLLTSKLSKVCKRIAQKVC